jgi:hypothetical protein
MFAEYIDSFTGYTYVILTIILHVAIYDTTLMETSHTLPYSMYMHHVCYITNSK